MLSRLLFTVTSDDGPHYWRLLSLPTFDGSSWNPPEEDLTDVDGGSSIDGVTSTSTQRFAIAALGTLVQTRSDWQIYGGNIASTLAGEFSFTLALALALFGLGALGVTLETGRRRWLPAALETIALPP